MKVAKCRPSRGKAGVGGAPRGGGRSGASTASGTGRRGVAGKGRSRPRTADGSKLAPDDAGWNKNLKLLVEYKEANGHCRIPTKTSGELGFWVKRQRDYKREGRLAQERIDRLDELGFDWGNSIEERWEKNYKQLKEFEAEHGHCRVPQSHALGNWVNDQRKRKGKLAQDRIDRLNDLGFCWTLEDRWNGKFKELKEFKEEHGHCNVPRSHALGTWVKTQRKFNRKGSLAQKYVDRLNRLGFVWNPGKQNQWTTRKRDANVISDGEEVISDAEPRADEGAPAQAANNSEDLPASRTSHVAESRRRRREQRSETSVENPSDSGKRSERNGRNEPSGQDDNNNEAESGTAGESQHEYWPFVLGNTESVGNANTESRAVVVSSGLAAGADPSDPGRHITDLGRELVLDRLTSGDARENVCLRDTDLGSTVNAMNVEVGDRNGHEEVASTSKPVVDLNRDEEILENPEEARKFAWGMVKVKSEMVVEAGKKEERLKEALAEAENDAKRNAEALEEAEKKRAAAKKEALEYKSELERLKRKLIAEVEEQKKTLSTSLAQQRSGPKTRAQRAGPKWKLPIV